MRCRCVKRTWDSAPLGGASMLLYAGLFKLEEESAHKEREREGERERDGERERGRGNLKERER